ncbi:hypothetical protein [Vreelandella venusta]|uniref:hypothetical protein n=1 Tax=Vreelandella venusta TaxID=44935 RepID=UPI0020103B9E|nr:hypothetical protein [Halomonas venusta]UQI38787.1 hypothetical protein M3L73_11110 [Halomonas venusta]
MIDAILYIPDVNAFNDDDPLPQGAVKTSDDKALIYYRGKTLPGDSRITVLASDTYTGTGTAQRLFDAIENNAEKMALYTSVHDLTPRTVTDEEGNETTITPPFAFGMLAESALPVPHSVSSRQGMEQLIRLGLDEQVDTAIDEIEDVVQRKIVRNWLQKAQYWERDNPTFIAFASTLKITDGDVDDYMRQASML